MARSFSKSWLRISVITVPVILSATLAGCILTGRVKRTEIPVLSYCLELKDEGLKVVTVTGSVAGTVSSKVSLASPCTGDGTGVEPIGLVARDYGGQKLGVERGAGSWSVESGGRDFTFMYDVVLTIEDRYSPDVRTMLTIIDGDRCRLLGKDVFIVPLLPVREGILVDVDFFTSSDLRSQWRSVKRRIVVPGLKELPSTMIVSGDYRYIRTKVGSTELDLAIAGEWSFGDEEFSDIILRIVSAEIALFGSSPRERHLFVCDRNPVKGYEGFDNYGIHFGGSMVLLLDQRLNRSELFDTPMSIIAHEFFHNWNGEALSPRSNDFLWFTEGATVYYSYRVLMDVDIITPKQYERKRDEILKRYMANPYLESVPIGSAANNDLHDKDMVNLLYDGGFLAAEALDEKISELTQGKIGLIDVLRSMYESEKVDGVDEEVLARSITEACGHDISGFLANLIHGDASAEFD